MVTITLIKLRFGDLTLHASRNWFEDLDLRKVGPSSSDGKGNHPNRPTDPILCFGPHSIQASSTIMNPNSIYYTYIEGSWWVQVNPEKNKLKEEAVTWYVKKPHCSLSHETIGRETHEFMAHFLLVLAWPPLRFCMSLDPPISLLYEGQDLKNLDMDPFSYVSGSGLG